MDPLSYMVQTVRMRTALYASVLLEAPWGVGLPQGEGAAFHAIVSGRCWFRLDGEGTWTELAQGDVVVLPRGDAHTFCDEPGSPIRIRDGFGTPPDPSGGQAAPPWHSGVPLGDLPAHTHVLCGHLFFDDRAANPLVGMLPPVIHFRASADGRIQGWLEPLLQSVAMESQTSTVGASAILARLSDVIVIQAIRAHVARLPENSAGWLRALVDPQLGEALSLIHQHPEAAWTVPGLAKQVSMSRSTFTARFAQLVGEPPARYVTRWRMHHAQRLLRSGNATVAEVASRVGYQTEPAFSRAFTRWVGSTPGAYRRDGARQVNPPEALTPPAGGLSLAGSG